MLDKIGVRLLNLINLKGIENSYVVLSADELMSGLDGAVDRKELSIYLDQLKNDGLIAVRYEDEREICLLLLPKGKATYQSLKDGADVKRKIDKKNLKYSFLGGSVGGALGGILAVTLALIFGVK